MSKRQHVRELRRNSLPHGRYNFIVSLRRSSSRAKEAKSNSKDIEGMRGMLKTTCSGSHRFKYIKSGGRRIYTELLMENAIDVAMLKLVHADRIRKIYKINLELTVQPPLG